MFKRFKLLMVSALVCSVCCLMIFSGCSADVAAGNSESVSQDASYDSSAEADVTVESYMAHHNDEHHDADLSEEDVIRCISDHGSLSADLISNLTYKSCSDSGACRYDVCFDYEGCNYTCVYDRDSSNVSEFHHLDEENGTHHSETHHSSTHHSEAHHNN